MKNKLFKVYKSSAGSGKTFTLIKEFLKLALASEDPTYVSRILAITFTNKASAEMKDRLIKTLKEAEDESSVTENDLLKVVQEDLGLEPKEFIKRAKNTLSFILHSYGDLSISTIDKFMLKVIKSFSRDLRIPNNFQIEMQEDQLLERVVSLLLTQIGEDPLMDHLILDYTKKKMREGKSWRIDDDLFKKARSLKLEGASRYVEEIIELSFKEYQKLISSYVEENERLKNLLRSRAEEAIQIIEKNDLSVDMFARGRSGYAKYFYNLHAGAIDLPNSYVLSAIENEVLYSGAAKKDKASMELIISLTPDLLMISKGIAEILEQNWESFQARRSLLENLSFQSLFGKLNQLLEQIKADENLVNISDFNRLIGKVVLNDPIPFIYERIGEKYRHIMVDEFQDTSTLQFKNLLPLIDESLSKGNENLIVGDAKQSIYRFRAAQVEQFSQMPNLELKEYQEDEMSLMRMESLKREYNEQYLDTNWRSSAEIIRFNNDFFTALENRADLSERNKLIYKGHSQKVPEKANRGGYIEVRTVEGKKEESEPQHLELIFEAIQDLRNRGFDYSDIAILCMKNKQVAKIGNYLNEKGIPLYSSEAIQLRYSRKVNFLVDLLQYTRDPQDDNAKLQLFNFLYSHSAIEGEKEEILANYIAKNTKGFINLLKEKSIPLPSPKMSHENLLQWFERQIRLYELDESYDPYLQFFEEYVFEFVQQNGKIEDFLTAWEIDKEKLSIELSDQVDAVQLMTIHKSKGLEFEQVIFPFADSVVNNTGGQLWTNELPKPASDIGLNYGLLNYKSNLLKGPYSDLYTEEQIKRKGDLFNSIYVAFTRAVDGLYIFTATPPKSSSTISLPRLLDEFKEQMEEGEDCFYRGSKANKKEEEVGNTEKSLETIELKEYYSSAWSSKVSLSLEMRTQWEKGEETIDSRVYGNLVHEILAKVDSVEDVEIVVESYYHSGKIDSNLKKDLVSQLSNLILKEDVRPFFESNLKVLNERSLLSDDGDVLRPDRIVENDSDLIILDYKSGEKRDADLKQVLKYRSELQKISSKKVSAYLLYLQNGELLKVA